MDALIRGGCPAKAVREVDTSGIYGAAVLQTHVAALDGVGWSWPSLRRGDTLALATRAFHDIVRVAKMTTPAPWWTILIGPWAGRLLLAIAPAIVPIDLPTYLGWHFTKVGEQTRGHLDYWIAAGRDAKVSVDSLVALRTRMPQEAHFDRDAILG